MVGSTEDTITLGVGTRFGISKEGNIDGEKNGKLDNDTEGMKDN
jgi:hypothetical protein